MLVSFDLHDLHAILVNIRAYPEYELNEEIIKNIIGAIKQSKDNDQFNQIRTALKRLPINKSEYAFVFCENVYSYIGGFIKNQRIYELLCYMLEELYNVIKSKNVEQIVDLADAIHNVPLIFSENSFKHLTRFWKYNIRPYQKKWDNSIFYDFKGVIKRPQKFKNYN